MKMWKKPMVVLHTLNEVNQYIKANAGTCILCFGRTI